MVCIYGKQNNYLPLCLALLLFICIVGTKEASAQDATLGDTDIRLYTISGNLGLQSHAYSSSRPGNLREPLGMIATANLNFSVLGFSSGLDIRYSTDQSRLQQDLNRFSFNGSWRWLSLGAGDVSPTFNNFSLRGTRVRGGHLEITPGLFRAEFTAGQVNRSVEIGEGQRFRRQSYERWLYGGRIGVGSERGTHFYLGIVYAKDIDDPLPEPQSGAGSQRPVPYPKENLTVSPDFQFSLFSRRFSVQAENTVSVFTANTRRSSLDLSEAGIPDFVGNIFTPRTSTRVNYATRINSRIDLDAFNLNVGFERVQPGFNSLGLRNIKDDQQTIRIEPQVSLAGGRLNLSGNLRLGRDNLLDQRTVTQKRQDIGINVQSQISANFSLGGGYNRLTNKVESNVDDDPDFGAGYPEQTIISQSINLVPVVNWMAGSASHTVSLSANYQHIDMDLDDGTDRDLSSSSLTLSTNYSLSFHSGFNINTTVNYARGDARATTFEVIGANAGLGHSFFERRLNLNLTGGFSRNSTTTEVAGQSAGMTQQQITGNLSVMYRASRSNTIRLTARTINNSLIEGAGLDFQELEVRLSINQRF